MNSKQFLIVLIIVFISSFLGGMSAQIATQKGAVFAEGKRDFHHELRTKALHLVGDDGKVRASFYLDPNNSPQFVLFDLEGTNRFNLGLAPAGNPGLSFNDENFKTLTGVSEIIHPAAPIH